MRKLFFFMFFLFLSCYATASVTGFWQTIDPDTHRPGSVVAIYPYNGKYYGKIIATYTPEGGIRDTIYQPTSRTPGIQGHPYYCGLDIVWNAETSGDTYEGFVIDPRDGKIYDAELWEENGNLILRGKVFIFGKNVTWPPFPEENFTRNFKKPDIKKFKPNIPPRH